MYSYSSFQKCIWNFQFDTLEAGTAIEMDLDRLEKQADSSPRSSTKVNAESCIRME